MHICIHTCIHIHDTIYLTRPFYILAASALNSTAAATMAPSVTSSQSINK